MSSHLPPAVFMLTCFFIAFVCNNPLPTQDDTKRVTLSPEEYAAQRKQFDDYFIRERNERLLKQVNEIVYSKRKNEEKVKAILEVFKEKKNQASIKEIGKKMCETIDKMKTTVNAEIVKIKNQKVREACTKTVELAYQAMGDQKSEVVVASGFSEEENGEYTRVMVLAMENVMNTTAKIDQLKQEIIALN